MENTSFCEVLRSLRKEKVLTQQQLSDITTVPKRTIEDWEAGRRTPPSYVQYLLLEKIKTL